MEWFVLIEQSIITDYDTNKRGPCPWLQLDLNKIKDYNEN